jgi:hypothetical protein
MSAILVSLKTVVFEKSISAADDQFQTPSYKNLKGCLTSQCFVSLKIHLESELSGSLIVFT